MCNKFFCIKESTVRSYSPSPFNTKMKNLLYEIIKDHDKSARHLCVAVVVPQGRYVI